MTKKPLPPTAEISDQDDTRRGDDGAQRMPGVVVVFASGKPVRAAVPLAGGQLEIGRGLLVDANVDDDSVSRAHALVTFDGRRWTVRDLGSRNGTFVDGARVTERVCETEPVIRLGRAILIATDDQGAHGAPNEGGLTTGARLRKAYAEIVRAAGAGRSVHLAGESGSGKELAARHFHASGPRASGPFVAVNCATIPEGVAERLLFGAVRGAYSGADASTDGWVQTADRGTLFLDEIAELDLAVQAKLLRVLETREVTALGAARSRTVDFGLCSATHRELRALVAEGAFRDDLYFRIGRPEVQIPPLRERRDEIPYHLLRGVHAREELAMAPAFVEACLLRHWPGNVREIVAEASFAAQRAAASGASASEQTVRLVDLAADAGRPIHLQRAAAATPTPPKSRDANETAPPARADILAVLRRHEGNVTAAARDLGMHRNQLRRWLEKEGVDPQSFSGDSSGLGSSPKSSD